MHYISVCNKCDERIISATPRYYCNKCRKMSKKKEAVTEIERLLREGTYRGKDIAKKFDVSTAYVSKIKRRIGLIKEHQELL